KPAYRRSNDVMLQAIAGWTLVALIISLCGILFVRRRSLNPRLDRLAARFSSEAFEGRYPEVGSLPSLDAIDAELGRLRKSMEALRKQLDDEADRRRQAEVAQRQLEERYGLAIRGADEVLWEWNLSTNQARFSPRWMALVGKSGEDLVDSI